MKTKIWILTGAVLAFNAISATSADLSTRNQLQFRNMKHTFLLSDSAKSLEQKRMKSERPLPEYVDVFVTVSDGTSCADLEHLGLKNAEPLTATLMVGTIDVDCMESLCEAEGVVSVTLSGMGSLRNDLSRSFSHVDEIHSGKAGLPCEYKGDGVIVSLFDSGVQPGHINFMIQSQLVENLTAESRVKAIYHYETDYDEMGNTVIKENIYDTPEQIAGFTTDDANETHGTHTLGIMTGSYTSKDFSASAKNDFRGMAPNADIVVACGPVYYSAVAKAIKRITTYAENHSQPCVINLSIGDNLGPHDGTDGFAAYLNECGATTPIIISAGNEGNINISLSKRFSDDDNEIKTIISPRSTIRTYLGVAYEACSEMQVWSEDNTPFTLEIGLINKKTGEVIYTLPYKDDGTVTYIANGEFEPFSTVAPNEDFDYYYTDSAIGAATGFCQENNRYYASIYYLLKKDLSHIDRHIVPFLIVRGEQGKRVDVYSDGYYNEFSNGKIQGWDNGSGNGSISNIACGENVISVGAYRSRQMSETDPIETGEVCDFSSYGELPDGRLLPDILSPGGWIASSMSTPFTENEGFNTDTYPAVDGMMFGETPYYWTIMQGTSQSAPAVAGIIALWLQTNPGLSPGEIKEILHETSVSCKEVTPQSAMGKIDALAGLKRAIEAAGINYVTGHSSETIIISSCGSGHFRLAAANEASVSVTVHNVQGQKVFSAEDSYPDTNIDLSHLQHGVYIISVGGKNSSTFKKILI